MAQFNIILKLLRSEKKITQQDLADALHISKSSINMYERGERQPNFETLELIADYFNVDIDYLLGRTDKTTKIIDPSITTIEFTSKDYTRDELDRLLEYAEFLKSIRERKS